jgi:DNA-binding SARP family transcriptional activator
MARLSIQLFGSFAVYFDSVLVSSLQSPRLQELLAYLLIYRYTPQYRAPLAYLLWPDSNEVQARTNLRNLLHQLKRAFPDADHYIHQDGQTIQWNAGSEYELDVERFEQAAAAAEIKPQIEPQEYQNALKAAINAYAGDLFLVNYSNWMIGERECFQNTYTRVLEALIHSLETQMEYDQAIDYAQRLLRHAPLYESAYGVLLRLQGLNGDRAGAVRTYLACREALAQHLGVEPGPATCQMYEDLFKLKLPATPMLSSGSAPLIGRGREWDRMLQICQSALAKKPQFLLLEGDAGSGKTRLLKEFLSSKPGGTAARSAFTRCNYSERTIALSPILAWIRAILPDGSDEAWMDEIEDEFAFLHNGKRRRVFNMLVSAAVDAGQPLILCLDDLQWCDAESLEWIHFLLQSCPKVPIMITGSIRPEALYLNPALVRFLREVREDAVLTHILLGPLSREETRLLGERLAGKPLAPEDVEHLYRETEGNPFFIVDTMWPTPAAGRQDEEGLTPEARYLLEDRLAYLSPGALEIGGIAACMGRRFSYSALKQIYGDGELELAYGLDELCQQRVVHACDREEYEFSHRKIYQVVFAHFGPARRRVYISRVNEFAHRK